MIEVFFLAVGILIAVALVCFVIYLSMLGKGMSQ